MDATTATAKRKRTATDIAAGEATAAATAAGVEEVSDAEVDEFYAILRRMRDASRRLCGAGVRPPARAPAWRPSFSWEDFAAAPPPTPPAPAPEPARPDERAAEDDTASATTAATTTPPPRAGLDLNAEPEPDAPAAPATPRSARVPA
ncbi:hypothetical protein ACP4OV_022372 [Aristida adscensionis]